MVGQRELCDIPLGRGSVPWPPVLRGAQKGPELEDESRHSNSECALYNLYSCSCWKDTVNEADNCREENMFS